jgi:UPF0716 protein FxsA
MKLFNLAKRPLIILIAGIIFLWLAIEWFLFGLISQAIGIFPTIVLSVLKGGFGLLLLGFVLRRFSSSFGSKTDDTAARLIEPALAILGAILICLPGFLTSIIGLALFAPSFRAMIMNKTTSGKKQPKSSVDTIDLSKQDYHEV